MLAAKYSEVRFHRRGAALANGCQTARIDWLQSELAVHGRGEGARIMAEGDMETERTGASALAQALVG
jgi:hypothetical protein